MKTHLMKENFKMKSVLVCLMCIAGLSSCDDYLQQDFFEFLFNSKDIKVEGECSDIPPLLSEGRFCEIYSMRAVDINKTVKNINNSMPIARSNKYERYKLPHWNKTPILMSDSVYTFINSEMMEQPNSCYDGPEITKILKQKGNYYTLLNDDLGRSKLFVWDVLNRKLFLLTSYEL